MPSPGTKNETQERTLEGMAVQRRGRGQYLCQSGTNPKEWYMVDILENDGLGSCTCDDFVYRRHYRYRRAGIAFDSFRCRHIRRVRCHVLDQILAPYLKKEKETY